MTVLHISDFFEVSSEKFSILCSDPESFCEEHSHEFDELVFIENGHGIHTIHGDSTHICQGDILYIKHGVAHSYQNLGDLKLTNLLINNHEKFTFINNLNYFTSKIEDATYRKHNWISPDHLTCCKDMLEKIILEQGCNDKVLSAAVKESAFLQLLMTLTSSMSKKCLRSNNGRIQQAIKWIHENSHNEIDLKILCDRFLISQRTFYRHISETTGLTPLKYLMKVRLISARKQIITGERSITEIAFNCGFADSNHFSTRYKGLFGISPSRERALNSNSCQP